MFEYFYHTGQSRMRCRGGEARQEGGSWLFLPRLSSAKMR